jgi:hypothetical protein
MKVSERAKHLFCTFGWLTVLSCWVIAVIMMHNQVLDEALFGGKTFILVRNIYFLGLILGSGIGLSLACSMVFAVRFIRTSLKKRSENDKHITKESS